MDPFLIFLMIVITIVSLVFIVAGIQVILILRQIQKTLNKTNAAIESAQYFFHNVTHPLTDVKAMGQGVKTGLYVAEHIAGWLAARSKGEEDAT